MPFKTFLGKNPPPQKFKKYKGDFMNDINSNPSKASKKYKAFLSKNKWWQEPMDTSKLESMLKENTKRQWAMYEKMSQEALPLLKNAKNDDVMEARAVHFMGRRDMTEACIQRKNRNYDALPNPHAAEHAQTYSFNVGFPTNSHDEHAIYHVDYDNKYFPFQCEYVEDRQVNVSALRGMTVEPRYQQRYASLYSQFVSDNDDGKNNKKTLTEAMNNFIVRGNDAGHLGKAAEKVMACLDKMDKDDTDFVFEEPDVYHAYTADYTVFVSTASARQDITPGFAVKIRRRLVIASTNYSSAEVNAKTQNIPLAEEIIVNVMRINGTYVASNKESPYQSENYCMVININLVCDNFAGVGLGASMFSAAYAGVKRGAATVARGVGIKGSKNSPSVKTDALRPDGKGALSMASGGQVAENPAVTHEFTNSGVADQVPVQSVAPFPRLVLNEDEKNVSTVHFFGQNAFSVSMKSLTPSNKEWFATGHESGMYVAGWLIRQLEKVAQGNTENSIFNALESNVESVGTYFTRQQNAGEFIKAEHNKYFHTKIWLSSPTLVVIAISPLKDNTKTIVVVWTVGKVITTQEANRAFGKFLNGSSEPALSRQASSRGSSGADPTDVLVDFEPSGAKQAKFPSLLRQNPLAPSRLAAAARFRSTLPMDLELELQSL